MRKGFSWHDFGIVFQYYLRKQVKSKAYIIVTVLLCAVSFASCFLLSAFSGGKDQSTLYIVDRTGIFAEELSFVRSVYKLLKGGLKRLEKVCCIVSASLLLLMILFHWLIVTRSIRFDMIDEQKFVRTILFLTEWPTVILSFVLSSIRSRNKEDRAKSC